MDGTEPDERNALIDTDMATLTYEDGLFEIDSFFNSSPTQADTITKAETSKDAQGAGVSTGEKTAPLSSQTDSKQNAQSVLPMTEQPVDTDEFATLIEDLDQVTAHEAVLTNPKGQLHFILNDPTSPSPKVTIQASRGLAEAVAAPNIAESHAASTRTASPQLGQTQTREERKPALDMTDGIQKSPTDNFQPNALDKAVSLTSVHSEKGLTLLSPRRRQPINPPPQNTAQDSLGSNSPDNKSLPLPSPSQAPGIERAMSGTSPPVVSSPAMPSSEGKVSLMEEMRDEDYYAKHSRSPETEAMHQPALIAVASKPNGERQAGINSSGNNGGTKVFTKAQIIKDADLAQQKAKAVLAANQKKKQPPPEASDMTDVDETESEIEETKNVNEGQTGNAKTKAASSKLTKKAIKPKPEAKSKPEIQLRKSTRNQPAIQYQDSDSTKASKETETEPSPEATVPAKRKAKPSPAPPAKRAKTEARPKTRAAKETVESQQPAGTGSETTARPSRVSVGRNPMSKREMKELRWAHIGPRVTPGPRKTRAQQEEEDKKKEEEEKKLPNPGRAAKERHNRKSA